MEIKKQEPKQENDYTALLKPVGTRLTVVDLKTNKIMTAVEKAEELVRKYYTFGLNNPAQSFSWHECKECALIAVDEILNWVIVGTYDYESLNEYWQEVKQEIESI